MRDRSGPAPLIACALVLATSATARADDPPSPPAPAPDADPQEVHVHGARRDIGDTSMRADEVRQVPGAFGDAFRAIESLPGVTPIVSGLPFFFVRGSPPGNVGYFIDGVRVPILYHLGFGPSVVHPGLIDRVDFYPGGYPARFGRFAGGILSADTRAPASDFHGEANARLFDAGALVEAPIADGQGSALVGGRYSYTAAILSKLAPNTSLGYWDYQGRATWNLGDKDRIGVFAFGSYDNLTDSSSGPTKEVFGTQFHRVDVRYDHLLKRGGHVRLAATVGRDETADEDTSLVDDMFALRAEADAPLSDAVRLRGGADMTFDHYALDRSVLDSASLLYPPRDNVMLGAWADAVLKPLPGLEIVPGVRGDIFNSRRLDHPPIRLGTGSFDPGGTGLDHTLTESAIPAIDPRVAARANLSSRVVWITTFGLSHQLPSFFVPVPGVQIAELKPTLQTSIQTSQGIEVALPAEITATFTAFFHDYLNLTDITETCNDSSKTSTARDFCVDDRVSGQTYGLEVFIRRPLTKKLTGWLSYTLSRSTRDTHVLGAPTNVYATIPSEFDRTHVLSAVAAYDLGAGWRAGGRFFFYTGRPYSETFLGVPMPPYNGYRLPSFWRIDARFEKRWRLGERAWVAFVIEGLNVTLNQEAISAQCTTQTTPRGLPVPDACAPEYIGPVAIPSIGVEASW